MITLWFVLVLGAEIVPGPVPLRGEPIGTAACVKCHPAVTAQWASSAHRLSSFNNPYYAAATVALRDELGHAPSTFCGDCHDPALVAQMTGPIDTTSREAQAGITCQICHGMEHVDVRGNGLFRTRLSGPKPGPEHAKHVARPLLRSVDLCGTCHRVGLPETVTQERWYRGQDEWTDWYDSGYAGRGLGALIPGPPRKTCADCHMPAVVVGPEEKAAKDGTVRSHRFLAANTALPAIHGDTEQLRATEAFLQDIVSLRLADGGPGLVDVVLHNHAVGHRFPGGTTDSNQVWIEWIAYGADGEILKASGEVVDGEVDPTSHQLRAWPLDADGRLLARRDVQHQRGVAFDTRLPPRTPRVVRYRVPEGTQRITARLRYRKFSKDYAAFACASLTGAQQARCLAPPITDMARDAIDLVDGRAPATTDWGLRAEHAAGLALGLSRHVVQAEAILEGGPPLPVIRARIAQALGQTDRVDAQVSALGDAAPSGALWIQASALARAYRTAPALAVAERLLERHPDDRHALALVARLRGVAGDAKGSLAIARRLLTVEPENENGLYLRLLARRELGLPTDAAEIEWARHRRATETDLALRRKWRAQRPGLGDPTEPVPEY